MPTGNPGQRPDRRRPRPTQTAIEATRDDNNTDREPDPPASAGRGSLTRHLTDPAIETAIEEFVATAPPLPEDVRSRLARLLRTNHCRDDLDPNEQAA